MAPHPFEEEIRGSRHAPPFYAVDFALQRSDFAVDGAVNGVEGFAGQAEAGGADFCGFLEDLELDLWGEAGDCCGNSWICSCCHFGVWYVD